jgi:L-threonylcarbamoyladenylate synthase
MTLILKINSRKPEPPKIRKAALIIRNGGIVVFPTETVYGIGANALDARACRKIFRIKKRKMDNPLIVHISSMKMANEVADIPAKYSKVLERIWPAPLSVVAKARKAVPKMVTAGLRTVSLRMPQNKVALMLIRESGVPIAAPSANISGRPSSTRASHAIGYFNGKVDAIIDAGPSMFGVESTIIDLSRFVLLRPGAYTVNQINRSFKKKITVAKESIGPLKSGQKPISPGTKYVHYSPSTPLFMFNGKKPMLAEITSGFKGRFAFIGSEESCRLVRKNARRTINLGKRREKHGIAANLFHALISLDTTNTEFAITEDFSEEGLGLAIMNRLRKACGHRYFKDGKELDNLVWRI